MRLSYAEFGLATIGVAVVAGFITTLFDIRKLEKTMATKSDLDDAITGVETAAAANTAAAAANATHSKQLSGIISDLTSKLTAAPTASDVDFTDEVTRLKAVQQAISANTDTLTKSISDANGDSQTSNLTWSGGGSDGDIHDITTSGSTPPTPAPPTDPEPPVTPTE